MHLEFHLHMLRMTMQEEETGIIPAIFTQTLTIIMCAV